MTGTDRELVVVLTTLGADADAGGLARTLVAERLAACVGVVPGMTSFYRWEGAVQTEAEQQLVVKTSRGRLAALEVRLRELHPYDVPEFIVLSASASRAYARWIAVETGVERSATQHPREPSPPTRDRP